MIRRFFLPFVATALLCGCTPPHENITIPFAVEFEGEPIACGPIDEGLVLTDLRFYVSDIRAVDANGSSVDIDLVADGLWQQPDLGFLDLEDGRQSCDNGTPLMNTALRGSLPPGEYSGLSFEIGVPFDRNHADPLTAVAPLGDAAMHWHWRAGYKFLRAGVGTPDDGFWIHLGSTGCQGTVRDITGCNSPNRVHVTLDRFRPGKDTVVLELAALLDGTSLEDATTSDCSSGPAEAACEAPFRAFGLIPGANDTESMQTIFRVGAGR